MRWIDVKLEKPKSGECVLVYCVPKFSFDEELEDFEILIGYREDDDWYLNSKDLDEIKFISHWMELPKKPLSILDNNLFELKEYAENLLKRKSDCNRFFIDAGIHNEDGIINDNYL